MRAALLWIALARLSAAADTVWQQDLDTLSTQLPRLHPNPFFHVSRADWTQAVADLRAAMPQLTDVEAMAGLARITAMVGDGHTNLFLTQRNSTFRMLPLQMRWFADGLFIIGAGPQYPRAVGARVVQIGDLPLQAAYDTAGALISHENDSWVREQSPNYLVNADLLRALKIAPSNASVTFVLEDAAGRFTLEVASLDPGTTAKLVSAPDPNAGFTALWRQHTDRYYWFTYVASSRTLYFAYNVCAEQSDLPFAQFNAQLWAAFDANPVERLVIDLRNNSGGNSAVLNPFLAAGIARGNRFVAVQPVVIIGRRTFSSGIINAIQMRQGPVMLVGEASGGSPNSYGEVQTLVLPNSKLNVSYSTRYFSFPGYPDGPLMPDVAVASYSSDYFARHDPFLAAAIAGTAAGASKADVAVFNAAAPRPGAPVASGSLATIFADLGGVTAADAVSIPLPRLLSGIEVLVNGRVAPLLAARASQVNFQVPAATELGAAAVSVRRDGREVAALYASIGAGAPGLYLGVVSGSMLTIYGNGQGATDPAIDDGAAPGVAAVSRLTPRVYVGGEQAEVLFSGLNPVFPGLWQVNVRVPDGVAGEMPVFAALSGNASNGVAVRF
ncbi:MAG TPA: hypothetical protein VKE70_27010 [Candidatus Solibacter sp.]|nr:hypothetical protein [Candidatus Solibacter sp.]